MVDSEKQLSLASRLVHADDGLAAHSAVAPAMHVSTTFRYSNDPDKLSAGNFGNPDAEQEPESFIYSRESAPNTTRLEAVLTSTIGGPSITYSSGLSAFHAMLVHLNPKRIAIGEGYHGCHGVINVLHRLNGLEKLPLDCDPSQLHAGDVIHVETPLNPTGEARNLQHYGEIARKVGAHLIVDATLAPPPLMDPFAHGADIIMHSGTKYFSGHSDMLCGTLSVHPKHAEWIKGLRGDRLVLGAVPGSFEGWLGMRSMRTLELRVTRQSKTATDLVSWLAWELSNLSSTVASTVEKIQHASLQPEAKQTGSWLQQQLPQGYGPVFAIWMKDQDLARKLPSKLKLFQHATSLGGVESLIEWRAMSDSGVDRRLLRVSIGVEGLEDLKDDFTQAFESLKKEANK